MKAMLNNAIKGDYIAAETDSSVSLYEKEMCASRKYPCSPCGGLLEISMGRGVSKPNFFTEKYKPKLEFPEGWEAQSKKPSVVGVWIFSGTIHVQFILSI